MLLVQMTVLDVLGQLAVGTGPAVFVQAMVLQLSPAVPAAAMRAAADPVAAVVRMRTAAAVLA